MNVLISVDGSAHTAKMLAYLVKHPDLLGNSPTVTVLTVHQGLPGFAARTLGKQAIADYHNEESEAILAPVTAYLSQSGVKFAVSKRVGQIAEEILAQASDSSADLIVMGARGHGSLGSMLLGSVTQKVLAASVVPVLVIR